jgi:phosphatidylserine decarboxylase
LKTNQHHYIERDTGQVCSERPIGDWIVNYLYSKKREDVPFVYQLLGSQWFSGFLGWVNYDFPLGQSISGIRRFLKNCAINLNECPTGRRNWIQREKFSSAAFAIGSGDR